MIRPHLINWYIVTRLLETRRVVISVPHHYPYFVQNNRSHQLIGALNLNHDGGDVTGWLEESTYTGVYITWSKHTFVQQKELYLTALVQSKTWIMTQGPYRWDVTAENIHSWQHLLKVIYGNTTHLWYLQTGLMLSLLILFWINKVFDLKYSE